MQINIKNGTTRIVLTKRERKTLVDAASLVEAISNNTDVKHDASALRDMAFFYGPRETEETET